MRTYGQFCPVAKAAELFCERWTALIIRDLALGATRFSELQRGVPLASPTILSRRLAQLEAEGVIARRRAADAGRWTYHLTEAGRDFVPVVLALGTWGQRWSRRELAEHEVDLGLLLWAVERSARAQAFGAGRSIVELEFPEQPEHKRRWWFLNEAGRTELCLEPPGDDVTLFCGEPARPDPDLARGSDARPGIGRGTARSTWQTSGGARLAGLDGPQPTRARRLATPRESTAA